MDTTVPAAPGFAQYLWLLAEVAGKNFERFDYGAPTNPSQLTPFVQPITSPATPLANVGPVHNLRGIRKTGFLAQYNNGISMTDLSDVSNGVVALPFGFKTSFSNYYSSRQSFQNTLQWALDNFLGAWDVAPRQDSGLLYVSAGNEGALVFLVQQGHLNRYWDSTPFASPSNPPSQILVPRLVGLRPLRAGQDYIVEDATAPRYSPNMWYRYTLCISSVEPTGSTTLLRPPWANQFGGDYINSVTLNLVPGTYQVRHQIQNPEFTISANDIGAPPARYFAQMFVEELDPNATPPETGWWAASRGTWAGVAQ